ncbi:MAG TPA: hypothetical protein VKS82_24530 [Streptosporangiaceae bacterium]|nr:hypothetical protein [Streptosporangiaceae bacterium]
MTGSGALHGPRKDDALEREVRGEVQANRGHVGTGQCPVKRYNEFLRDLIVAGKATPSLLVSHELPLDDAPAAYEKFGKRADGYTKVLLHP